MGQGIRAMDSGFMIDGFLFQGFRFKWIIV